jgi:hypothetical protein
MNAAPGDLYQSMATGPAQTPPAPPAPAPSGGNPLLEAQSPIASVLLQIAQQYGLLDANGQPDLAQAQQIYDQNPSAYTVGNPNGGTPTAATPVNMPGVPGATSSTPMGAHAAAPGGLVPGAVAGATIRIPGYLGGTPTPTPGNGPMAGPVGTPDPQVTSGSTMSTPVSGAPGTFHAVYDPSTGAHYIDNTSGAEVFPFGQDTTTGSMPDTSPVGLPSGGAAAPGGPNVDPSDLYHYAQLVKAGYAADLGSAMTLWNGMNAQERAQFLGSPAGGGTAPQSADSAASLAQAAAQFAQTMAFNRAKQASDEAVAQQTAAAGASKANQDYQVNQANLFDTAQAQKQSATTSALGEWSKNIGLATSPALQAALGNGNFISGGAAANAAAMGNQPTLRFDPALAYGAAPAPQVLTAPNIPSIQFPTQQAA